MIDTDIADYTCKLFLDYAKRIEDCQLLLTRAEAINRRLRRENAPLDERLDVICEMKTLNAQIVAYTQAKVDIGSIQQELGV